ncbi:MAG: hypothetical protein CMH36_08920 [Microbacterium sp.]|uniref:hypothetical protein n=1 Tax=uncultured Microbacterium sp. TaxID=191216 RepID=UPI000C93A0C1|nr:hypothetical protein [Microbacterium sp.]
MTEDVNGNLHAPRGTSQGGQFAGKVPTAPEGGLTLPEARAGRTADAVALFELTERRLREAEEAMGRDAAAVFQALAPEGVTDVNLVERPGGGFSFIGWVPSTKNASPEDTAILMRAAAHLRRSGDVDVSRSRDERGTEVTEKELAAAVDRLTHASISDRAEADLHLHEAARAHIEAACRESDLPISGVRFDWSDQGEWLFPHSLIGVDDQELDFPDDLNDQLYSASSNIDSPKLAGLVQVGYLYELRMGEQ